MFSSVVVKSVFLLIPQNCNFSKFRPRLPDDGPGGPKHIGANIRYFNSTFEHFICLIKGAFVGEKNFSVIKMHGTKIKIKNLTICLPVE
jgi:hypothetical protein